MEHLHLPYYLEIEQCAVPEVRYALTVVYLYEQSICPCALQMFIRAKKAPNCPWQVYVASALMEWHHEGGRDVARKIFEKGLEIPEFLVTAQYILQYVDFLLGELP